MFWNSKFKQTLQQLLFIIECHAELNREEILVKVSKGSLVYQTRLTEVGEMKDVDADFAFFWRGRKNEKKREAGVGFAIKTVLVGKLWGLPKGIDGALRQ